MKTLVSAVVAAWVMLFAGQASAEVGYVYPRCATGCAVSAGVTGIQFDYAVPTDGTEQLWEFWIDNGDPLASLFLLLPNQKTTYTKTRLSDGSLVTGAAATPPFKWEVTNMAGYLGIRVRGPASYDLCSDLTYLGVCAQNYQLWGNGGGLRITTALAGTVFSRVTPMAIPEPATWAMMLIGFFGLGGALRRRRAALTAA